MGTSLQLPVFYKLQPALQTYDWGNRGDGIIRKFLASQSQEPFAELWMGSHSKAPAKLSGLIITPQTTTEINHGSFSDAIDFDQAIQENPDHLIGHLHKKGYTTLPFLFKILDAARPLSIQAHPDKQLAETLHKDDPAHYPDANHKPEIAISLGQLEAMAGFRHLHEIQNDAKRLQPLDSLFFESNQTEKQPKDSLQQLYTKIMKSSAHLIQKTADELLQLLQTQKIQNTQRTQNQTKLDDWFVRLTEIYGTDDPGVFAIYLLNYITLGKNEAIFLGPNEPHAYLKGEILECMATSDNVVRGGLTSKYKDVNTLLSMLSYRSGPVDVIHPTQSANNEDQKLCFNTPADEFQVSLLYDDTHTTDTFELEPLSVVLFLSGTALLKITTSSNTYSYSIDMPQILYVPADLYERQISLMVNDLSKDARVYAASTRL